MRHRKVKVLGGAVVKIVIMMYRHRLANTFEKVEKCATCYIAY